MTTFNVDTEAELRDAIFQISNDFALDGTVAEVSRHQHHRQHHAHPVAADDPRRRHPHHHH